MNKSQILKVAVVGPESTGKSFLTKYLASYFDTIYVPEFAREYCKDLDRNYTLEDEENIFYGQIALEEKLVSQAQNNLLFFDTMPLTVKIWCDHLFGFTPQPILEKLKTLSYDLYLLMDIDLPWEEDALRDFPKLREHFMQKWHDELEAIGAHYTVISGLGNQRLDNAKKTVEAFIKDKQEL